MSMVKANCYEFEGSREARPAEEQKVGSPQLELTSRVNIPQKTSGNSKGETEISFRPRRAQGIIQHSEGKTIPENSWTSIIWMDGQMDG